MMARALHALVLVTIFGVTLGGLLGVGVFDAPRAAADPGPVLQRTAAGVTADALPTVQIDGVVWDQEIVGDTVYAGGEFTNARPAGAAPGTNQTPRTNLLAYNIRTGALITTFAPTLNGKVKAISASPDGSRIYVGGSFTTVNGANRYRIAAFSTASGALVSTFAPSINATVNAISVSDTAVYAGGGFNKVGAVDRPRVAAFSPTNGALLAWAPAPDASVNAIQVTPNQSKVIIAGSFGTVNGSTATGLASLDAASGALLPFAVNTVVHNYGTSAAMLSLSTDGTNIYSAGYWYGGTGNFEGALAADPETGDITWLADCHGDTYDAGAAGGVVYAVSHHHYCSNIGGFPDTNPRSAWYRANAFTVEPTGTVAHNGQGGYADFYGQPAPSVVNWFPTVPAGTFTGQSQGGWTTTGNSEYVVQGGEFPSVNGVAQQGLVRFAIPSLAPKKQGPRVTGSSFNPTVLATSNHSVRVNWQANWDRDDQTLSYDLTRADKTTPVHTTSMTNQFWNRPSMSFTDDTVVAGQTYKYRIAATDPDGNRTESGLVSITVPATVSPYLTQVVDDGATDYWRMSGGTGSYPNYTGPSSLTATAGVTASAPGAITADDDGAAAFDGSTGSAASGSAVAGPNTFTVEAWFKTSTTSGGKIVGFGNAATGSSGSYDRHIYMDNDGRLNFGVYNGSTSTIRSGSAFNNGEWHHVAGEMSSAGMVLYVDGIKVGSNGVTSGQDYSGYWRIGSDNLNSWPNQPTSASFNGTIDEVAIYPTALSAAQLRDHYTKSGRTADLPAAPSDAYGKAVYDDDPALYWRLDETSGSSAADTSTAGVTGLYSGGYTQGAASNVAKPNGTAVSFDGTNGTVASSSAFDNPTTYTEELWFKTTSTRGGKLIGFGDRQSGTSNNYDRHVYLENSGQVTFGTYTGQLNTTTSPEAYNDGVWHQVVATQSSAGMKLYVDGVVVGTNAQTSAQGYSGYWRVGGDSTWTGDPFLNGSIDEVAVYSSALSAAQVQAHYAASPVSKPPVVENSAPVASFVSECTAARCDFDGTASADSDGTLASYAWDFGDDATSTLAKPSHTFAAAGTYSVKLTVKDDVGATDTVTRSVIVTKEANRAPVAAFTSSTSALAASFDGSTSTDSDGTIASYAWKFGDGSTGTGKTTSRTFAGTGAFSVTLTVTDNTGATTSVTKKVSVAPAKFASDTFDRTATKWGTSDQGGAWTLTGASAYSTNGSVGNVKLGSAGAGATAALNSVSQKNVNVVADITIDKPATGSGTYTSLIARKVGTSDYRMTFQELPAGAIRLNLTRTVGGTATTLKSLNLSGLTYTAVEAIRVRFTVTGSGTTSLSGKVWKAGTAEPATAQITATDTTASLQVAGGFALYNYLGSSATTFPVTISVDDLLLTSN